MDEQSLLSPTLYRIFIVDDHELMRLALAQLLGNQPDMEVCGEADTEDEAYQLICETRPNAAVTDVKLKQGSGLQLIRRVKSEWPSFRPLVFSMYDDALIAEQAIQAGAAGFVNKQSTTEVVLDALRIVLRGEIFVDESMRRKLVARAGNARALSPAELLSDREMEVFRLVGQGMATRDMAKTLQISTSTIETYFDRMKTKLHLKDAPSLIRTAIVWSLSDQKEGS